MGRVSVPLVPGSFSEALSLQDWELLLNRAFNLEMKRFSEDITLVIKRQAFLPSLFVIMKFYIINLSYPRKSIKNH